MHQSYNFLQELVASKDVQRICKKGPPWPSRFAAYTCSSSEFAIISQKKEPNVLRDKLFLASVYTMPPNMSQEINRSTRYPTCAYIYVYMYWKPNSPREQLFVSYLNAFNQTWSLNYSDKRWGGKKLNRLLNVWIHQFFIRVSFHCYSIHAICDFNKTVLKYIFTSG